jgi:ribosome-associated protein
MVGMEANGDLEVGGLTVAASALSWTFVRAGGPGGQHQNKVSSAVTLDIDLTALTGHPTVVERVRSRLGDRLRVSSKEHRSQAHNRRVCLERATEKIAVAAQPPPPPRRPTRPTKGSVKRRLEGKRRDAETKQLRRRPEW